jgi:hypothetical protein
VITGCDLENAMQQQLCRHLQHDQHMSAHNDILAWTCNGVNAGRQQRIVNTLVQMEDVLLHTVYLNPQLCAKVLLAVMKQRRCLGTMPLSALPRSLLEAGATSLHGRVISPIAAICRSLPPCTPPSNLCADYTGATGANDRFGVEGQNGHQSIQREQKPRQTKVVIHKLDAAASCCKLKHESRHAPAYAARVSVMPRLNQQSWQGTAASWRLWTL